MTAEEYYQQFHDITEGFLRRQRIHHHFIRIIKEVQLEADQENLKLRTELAKCLLTLQQNAPAST